MWFRRLSDWRLTDLNQDCSGIPSADISAVAAAVHAGLVGLQRGVNYWVYLNECCHVHADGSVFDCPFASAPLPELDLISFGE